MSMTSTWERKNKKKLHRKEISFDILSFTLLRFVSFVYFIVFEAYDFFFVWCYVGVVLISILRNLIVIWKTYFAEIMGIILNLDID